MTRNLYHRIECAFPIYDAELRQEILDFIGIQLNDNVKARIIDEEMNNHYLLDETRGPYRSQIETYKYYRSKNEF